MALNAPSVKRLSRAFYSLQFSPRVGHDGQTNAESGSALQRSLLVLRKLETIVLIEEPPPSTGTAIILVSVSFESRCFIIWDGGGDFERVVVEMTNFEIATVAGFVTNSIVFCVIQRKGPLLLIIAARDRAISSSRVSEFVCSVGRACHSCSSCCQVDTVWLCAQFNVASLKKQREGYSSLNINGAHTCFSLKCAFIALFV